MNVPRKNFLNSGAGLIALYFFLAAAAAVKVGIHETRCSVLIDQIVARQDLNSVATRDVNLNTGGMGFLTHFLVKHLYPQKSSVAQVLQNQRDILDLIREVKREFLASADASLALLGFTVLFLASASRGDGTGPEANLRKIYALLSVSLVFFVLGISCPVLTAVVKGQHNLVGGFFIETTSKGIVSTVVTLLKSGDWIISILLTAFSICIPIFKGAATLIACRSGSNARRLKTARVLEMIGKWSLTDVMVAAVLLGCFSLNAIKEESGGVVAVPRFALGFFIIYCVLAARTSYLLKGAVASAPGEKSSGARSVAGAALLAFALAAGAVVGYFAFDNFSYGRTLGDIALVKLVRTHTELIDSKISVSPGQATKIPFELPFRGTLNVKVRARAKLPLEIDVLGAGAPLPGFKGGGAEPYDQAGAAPAGKYNLAIRNNSSGELLQSDAVSVHITLDP